MCGATDRHFTTVDHLPQADGQPRRCTDRVGKLRIARDDHVRMDAHPQLQAGIGLPHQLQCSLDRLLRSILGRPGKTEIGQQAAPVRLRHVPLMFSNDRQTLRLRRGHQCHELVRVFGSRR